jgi:hypothetical protein
MAQGAKGAPMSERKGIVIVCNLDTRGEEIVFVKDLIAGRGHEPILLDFSMEEPPPFPGDIRTEEVAARGGLSIDVVREKYRSDRDAATNNQIAGAAAIVDELVKKGRVHGIIGIGGGTATLVATSIMKRLPFGMPKLMASPMAAHPAYIDKYVGTRDITMHYGARHRGESLLGAQIVNAVGHLRHGRDDAGHRYPLRQALRRRLVLRIRRDGRAGGHRHAGGRRLHPDRVPCAGQGRPGDGGDDRGRRLPGRDRHLHRRRGRALVQGQPRPRC